MAVAKRPKRSPALRARPRTDKPSARGNAVRSQLRRSRASLERRIGQLEFVHDAAGVVSWVWDIASDHIEWFGDRDAMLGLRQGAFSGRYQDYLAQVHPDDVAGARGVFIDCLKGRQPAYHAEERVIFPDGSVHWLETFGRAEYGRGGRAVRMAGVVRDITERKSRDTALRSSESRFERAFNASPHPQAITRADDQRFVAVNAAFERISGYTAQDAIGRTARELGLFADEQERQALFARIQRDVRLRDVRVHLRRKDGAVRITEFSFEPIEIDGELHRLSQSRDVTDAFEANRRLQESLRKFASVFETSPEAIAVARARDGVHIEVNSAWSRLIGHARESAIGRSALEMEIWVDAAARVRLLDELARAGRVSNFAARFRRADGTAIDVLLSCEQVELQGENCLVHVWRDVSEQRRAERLLAESEEKFAKAFYASPDAIAITRMADGALVELNAGFERMIGIPLAQAIGRRPLDLGLWDKPVLVRMLAELRANGRVTDFERVVHTPDGRVLTVMFSAERIDIAGVPHLLSVSRDVTEQRRAVQALAASERKYRGLYEAAQDGIAILSPDGVLVDANPVLCLACGYTCEELLGRPLTDLLTAENNAHLPLMFTQLTERGTLRFEAIGQRKDGSTLPVEIRAWRLPDGTIQAIVRDITERKREEELVMNIARGVAATTGEAFFRSLVEHLARALGASHSFVGELVAPRGELVRTLAFFAEGKVAPNFEYQLEGSPCINAVEKRGTVIYPDHVAERFPADAGLRRMGVQGYAGTSLFDADGRALGILVVLSREPIRKQRYVTSMLEIFAARAAAELERSRAEARILALNASLEQRVRERTAELQEANRELESFSYSVSHDLRAPVRAILGFTGILTTEHEAALPEEARRYLSQVDRNAKRMGELIEDLLEFSRVGRGAIDVRRLDTRALVVAVLEDLGAADKVEVGELPAARGDASLLRQVWHNLVSNAIKFSRNSDPPRVKIHGSTLPDGRVEYCVQDNGCGFDARYADKLFGVFQRLHSEREFEGTGVGLAIVHRIVTRHGGSVTAESAPGDGARFSFILPA